MAKLRNCLLKVEVEINHIQIIIFYMQIQTDLSKYVGKLHASLTPSRLNSCNLNAVHYLFNPFI
uniref:Uncharacterized protein n=1 Tax=Helianthus annuus TaxID=4232 RepID=A0A251S3W7_HELAN